MKKFKDCQHQNTTICEPHLAGARQCLDCGAERVSESAPYVAMKRQVFKYAFKNKNARLFQKTAFFHPDWHSALDEIKAHGFIGDDFVYFRIETDFIFEPLED